MIFYAVVGDAFTGEEQFVIGFFALRHWANEACEKWRRQNSGAFSNPRVDAWVRVGD